MIFQQRRLWAVFFAAAIALAACGSDATSDAGSSSKTPAVAIEVVADPMSGLNLFVEVSDFAVAPERASTAPVAGEGHMHLYIDGERTMRFYNTALHLGGLEPGEHTIEVELSQNDHSAYEADGEPIRASQTITVEEGEPSHGHGSDIVDTTIDPPPSINLGVTKDPKSGWNVSVETENFTILPRSASTELVDGEGHMHLYIDGEKITRLYGSDWHIAELSEGSHTIEVELSHNDHAAYGLAGERIIASAMVEVSAEEAGSDGHDDHDSHGNDHSNDGALDMPLTDADTVVMVTYFDGAVDAPEERVEVELGSTVGIMIEADVADDLHVHGYDMFIDVDPGTPGSVVFTADVPGVFEVELESAGTFLFEIQVG